MEVKHIFETMEYGPAPESSIEAMDYLNSHNNTFQLFIKGEWVTPTSNEYSERSLLTLSPSSDTTLPVMNSMGLI